ncbi:MAG: hypothetical protein KC443_21175, partial [Anaerolineales bacterium]|nr:hypothetical protein [Anaerolineales bacterium]
QKTRQSIASGGTYINLIVTGIIWLIGFASQQFLSPEIVPYVWLGLSIPGGILATVLGIRVGRRVRSPSTAAMAKRAGLFWLVLILYGITIITIAQPTDGKQVALLVIMFVMLGQLSMGLLLSFAAVWWALPITALALLGYFLFPTIFYLWMAVLGGGGMIVMGLYIRLRW